MKASSLTLIAGACAVLLSGCGGGGIATDSAPDLEKGASAASRVDNPSSDGDTLIVPLNEQETPQVVESGSTAIPCSQAGGCTGRLAGQGATAGFDVAVGTTVSAQLTGDAGTDYDLFLSRYDATSNRWNVVARSEGATADERISFKASADGRFRFSLVNYNGGSGSFTLRTSASGGSSNPPANPPPAALPPASPPSSTPPASGGNASVTCGLPNFQAELLQLINQYRAQGASCGGAFYGPAPAVSWNGPLTQAAAAHSNDMVNNNFLGHTGSNGSRFDQRVSAAGYVWRTGAENIAAGRQTVQGVMTGWMNSPGHCSNIMNNSFRDVGVACVPGTSANTYRQGGYWTMVLGAQR